MATVFDLPPDWIYWATRASFRLDFQTQGPPPAQISILKGLNWKQAIEKTKIFIQKMHGSIVNGKQSPIFYKR